MERLFCVVLFDSHCLNASNEYSLDNGKHVNVKKHGQYSIERNSICRL